MAAVLRYTLHALATAHEVLERLPMFGWLTDFCLLHLTTLLRCRSGLYVAEGAERCKRPGKLLRLYDFEACPYCRKVRETLSVLDLDAEVRPCPKVTLRGQEVVEGSRFRAEVVKLGLPARFPVLVDENTGQKIGGSAAIDEYLWTTYGDAAFPPLSYRLTRALPGPFNLLPILCRPRLKHGVLRMASRLAAQPLEFWGCEASPAGRMVKEALCVLEVPYMMHAAVPDSAKRLALQKRFGRPVQIPCLWDPNTKVVLDRSGEIVAYLYRTYQEEGAETRETWLDFQNKVQKESVSHGKAD